MQITRNGDNLRIAGVRKAQGQLQPTEGYSCSVSMSLYRQRP